MEKDMQELLELTRENHKILRGMQRSARIGTFFRVIYWAIIIGSLYGTYYFLQPYVNQLLDLYSQVNASIKNVQGAAGKIPNPGSLTLPPELLKQLDSITKNQ